MIRALTEMQRSGMLNIWSVLMLVFSYAVLILVTLPVHEFAHAFVADKLGDRTARYAGRLSLNPFRHLDILGTVMLLTVGFGYAKPVPVDPRQFTKNRRNGMAWTAAAGPLSNFLMAFVALLLFRIICLITGESVEVQAGALYISSYGIYYVYIALVQVFASINLALAVFNLLPVPPLDGSRILGRFLPAKWQFKMMQYERYITLAVFLLLFVGWLDKPLLFLRGGLGFIVCTLLGLPNYFA